MGEVAYPVAITITCAFGIASTMATLLPEFAAMYRFPLAVSAGAMLGILALKYKREK